VKLNSDESAETLTKTVLDSFDMRPYDDNMISGINYKILAECYAMLRVFIEKKWKKIAKKDLTKKISQKKISEFFS
jgi:predicted HTH transcriptional regulator